MFAWLERWVRNRRAQKYAAAHPDDLPAAQAIVAGLNLEAQSAREVAEMVAGRPLTSEEWARFGHRWERAWKAIVVPR
jgi:hypothetical protein